MTFCSSAYTVINPASYAGLLLAGATHGVHLADHMADPATTDGRAALRTRGVRVGEIGIPSGLGIASVGAKR